MDKRIDIHCHGCGKIHNVLRTDEIPVNAIRLNCNWCPDCEADATEYYHEWVTWKTKPRGTKSNIEQMRIDFRFNGEENTK